MYTVILSTPHKESLGTGMVVFPLHGVRARRAATHTPSMAGPAAQRRGGGQQGASLLKVTPFLHPVPKRRAGWRPGRCCPVRENSDGMFLRRSPVASPCPHLSPPLPPPKLLPSSFRRHESLQAPCSPGAFCTSAHHCNRQLIGQLGSPGI